MMTYLANVDKDTFWAHRSWDSFARIPDKEKQVVVLPFVGFADWGLGHPLDAEETVSMAVLRDAVERTRNEVPLLVIPPLRFVLGPYENGFFALDSETAYQLVEEIVHSILISGFRRVVFYNSSPWNEDIINKACARDFRIKYGLQIFCINLYGLGLDFHPVRSRSRENVQTLCTFLLQREPVVGQGSAGCIPSDALEMREAETGPRLAGSRNIDEANRDGPEILAGSGEHLARLFHEIAARPPLPNKGAIEFKESL